MLFLLFSFIITALLLFFLWQPIIKYYRNEGRERTVFWALFTLGTISALIFGYIYKFTLPLTEPAGNGNPFLLFMPIAIGFLLMCGILIAIMAKKKAAYKQWKALYLTSYLIFFLFLFFQIRLTVKTFNQIENQSLSFDSPILNIHTNSVFFNGFTFFIIISISIIIGYTIGLLKRKT